MKQPNPIIANYIASLNRESVVSYSHIILRNLYNEHGKCRIDAMIREHFKANPESTEPVSAPEIRPGLYKNNTSGYRGVSLHKASGKWWAKLTVNHITINCGYHDTTEQANAAVQTKRKELHDSRTRLAASR